MIVSVYTLVQVTTKSRGFTQTVESIDSAVFAMFCGAEIESCEKYVVFCLTSGEKGYILIILKRFLYHIKIVYERESRLLIRVVGRFFIYARLFGEWGSKNV